MKLYVGNLSFSTTEIAIRNAFSAFGTVDSVSLINDRDSGRSKGFGFIEMNNDQEARAAIAGLNGKQLDERNLRVNEAQLKEDRPARGGFGGKRSGYRW
ncbi:MAG: RNA-binding protein [Victivallaceae bacterium]|nr:RNA-binding protein [Victivallaceae bacterium]